VRHKICLGRSENCTKTFIWDGKEQAVEEARLGHCFPAGAAAPTARTLPLQLARQLQQACEILMHGQEFVLWVRKE